MKGTKPVLRQASDAVDRVPAAPKWLSGHAKTEWKRILPSLVKRRILTPADLGSVENYCVAIGRVRQIEKTLQESSLIDPIFVRMQDKAMQTARQLAAELGLTPVSRSRPSVRDDNPEDDEDSPFNVS